MIGSISRRLRSWLTGQVPAETVSVQPVVSAPPCSDAPNGNGGESGDAVAAKIIAGEA